METVIIPSTAVNTNASYIVQVLTRGHVPGVLSGSGLSGKAKTYAAHYARSRRTAETIARQHGVNSGVVAINVGTEETPMLRNCRVWLKDAQRVTLALA